MKQVLGSKRNIMIFVFPALLIYSLFVLYPIINNVYLSLFKTNLMSTGKFVGLRNFVSLSKDRIFLSALKNNMFMVLGSLIAHLPISLIFGNWLFRKIRGTHFFQTIFFMPCVICGVAVGMLWTFIYHSEFGLLNNLLSTVGLSGLRHEWLSDKSTALISIILVVMWQYVGYHMIIQLAAMRAIPQELYEAADIDGATRWQQFTKITFPMIKYILRIDCVLVITGSLKYYDLVAVMTGGGPNHATELMSTYMFRQGFRTLKYGSAAAIGVVLLVLCILTIVLSNLVFHSDKVSY